MPTWQASAADSSYSHYFSLKRPPAPADDCESSSLSPHVNSLEGDITTLVHSQDFSALSHEISGDVILDINFVEAVFSSTGPVIVGPCEPANWQWTSWPTHIEKNAESEEDYYPWLEWALFRPAAHAVAAVCDRLYAQAGMQVPLILRGDSATRSIYQKKPPGTTDILHQLRRKGENRVNCTAHEVKRSRVLEVDGADVLELLARLANVEGGWEFREATGVLEGKASNLLSQCIDELILYDGTHIVLSTQDRYVLLCLNDSQQFDISRVYSIHDSSTQTRDMAELVLFYTHGLLTRHTPYPGSRSSSVSVHRVTVPAFSPRLFQCQDTLLCSGPLLVHRAKLAVLERTPDKLLIPWPLSVQLYTSSASWRHDEDIVISFGRLVFWFFEAHIVAKAAYQSSASDRLLHKFAVYNVLRALQGVVIPSLFGLYRNLDDGSSMLITSYAGVTLKDFNALCLRDRQILLSHVIQLHQAGVQHNDLEPRNVTISQRSGPVIIDFDNATLEHVCTGLSCKELSQLSQCLGLELRAELSRPRRSSSSIVLTCFCIFLILLMAICSMR